MCRICKCKCKKKATDFMTGSEDEPLPLNGYY